MTTSPYAWEHFTHHQELPQTLLALAEDIYRPPQRVGVHYFPQMDPEQEETYNAIQRTVGSIEVVQERGELLSRFPLDMQNQKKHRELTAHQWGFLLEDVTTLLSYEQLEPALRDMQAELKSYTTTLFGKEL